MDRDPYIIGVISEERKSITLPKVEAVLKYFCSRENGVKGPRVARYTYGCITTGDT